MATRTLTEERAIKLLGSGLKPVHVAAAVGITESRISQLLSDSDFANEVTELKFKNLQKHNDIDSCYDTLEQKVLNKLDKSLDLVFRPLELVRVLNVLNTAKRRGQSSPESVVQQSVIVNLTIPSQIVQKFSTNINNQVISAGEQTLETIQSSALLEAGDKDVLRITSSSTDSS